MRAGKPNQNAQVVPLTTPKGVSHNHTDGVRIADELVSQIAVLRAGMSGTERLILKHRLLSSPRRTLQELGNQLGVTRERVRQIQARLTDKIDSYIGSQLRVITTLARQRLSPVIAAKGGVGLIRFRGHLSKGGYDVQNGITHRGKTRTPTVQ